MSILQRKLTALILSAALILAGLGTLGLAVHAAAPVYDQFEVQGYDNNSGDYIISSINIKDFGAKGDGVTDDTGAIKAALRNALRQIGPCVVYFPAGTYRVTSPGITVYTGTTLRGQWNDPSLGTTGEQTVILADYEPEDIKENSAGEGSLFLLEEKSAVMDLCVYYPRQSVENVKEYNYTFWATNHSITVQNVTLYNSYLGINAGTQYGGSAHYLTNIYGTVLKEGIYFDWNYEVSNISNVEFDAKYWKSYDPEVDEQAVKDYTRQHAVALRMGKVDDSFVYNLKAPSDQFLWGVQLFYNEDIPASPRITYGLLIKLNGATLDKGDKQEPDPPHIYEVDPVENSDAYTYEAAADRFPTKEDLFVVTADPYNAPNDGQKDATQAIQTALDDAGENGGGTVYLPGGKYLITEALTVPENVELRGAWESPHIQSPSELLIRYGRGEPEKAVITLSRYAGVHGLTARFPEHSFNDFAEYPWVVRGAGEAAWVEYLTIVNGYNGVDFGTERCDYFLMKGVWGTAINLGARIGAGSENGVLENNMFSFGTWYEDCGRSDGQKIENYCYANATGYLFEDCRNIQTFSTCIFGLKTGMQMGSDRGEPENVLTFRALLDNPFGTESLKLTKGNNLVFVGLSTGSHPDEENQRYFIRQEDSCEGTVLIYGQNSWGGASNLIEENVKVYDADSQGTQTISFAFESTPEFVPSEPSEDPDSADPTDPGNEDPEDPKEGGCGSMAGGGAGLSLLALGAGIAAFTRRRSTK